jgi:hypothetical protein
MEVPRQITARTCLRGSLVISKYSGLALSQPNFEADGVWRGPLTTARVRRTATTSLLRIANTQRTHRTKTL